MDSRIVPGTGGATVSKRLDRFQQWRNKLTHLVDAWCFNDLVPEQRLNIEREIGPHILQEPTE